MHSKWLDAGLMVAAFHYQNSFYDSIRPPSFGTNPEKVTVPKRTHRRVKTADELKIIIDEHEQLNESWVGRSLFKSKRF